MNYEIQLEDKSVIEVNEYTQSRKTIRPHGSVKLQLSVEDINVYDSQGLVNLNV